MSGSGTSRARHRVTTTSAFERIADEMCSSRAFQLMTLTGHATAHSITSSARAESSGGTSSPSALAAWRLMTSSNLVDCTTGRSAGFSGIMAQTPQAD
jgi:hypothetical protein